MLLLCRPAFTVPTGQAHWDTLLRARAVENLCYVVAAAQTGCHPGNRETYGHSMIIGPWGQVLGDAGSSEGVITAAFDRAGIDETAAAFFRYWHTGLKWSMNKTVQSEDPIDIAKSRLLVPTGLDEQHLDQALNTLLQRGVDTADLYFQVIRHESWSLEDGIVKEGSHSIDQGVGVRAMSGEKTGFAYSDEIVLPALMHASQAASAIARQGHQGQVQAWRAQTGHSLYPPLDPLASITDAEKVQLLQQVDRSTRAADPRVVQVMASLAAVHEVVLVYSSDGVLAADVRPLVRMNVSVIVEDNGRREQGYSGGGRRCGYSYFMEGGPSCRVWPRSGAPGAD